VLPRLTSSALILRDPMPLEEAGRLSNGWFVQALDMSRVRAFNGTEASLDGPGRADR
jgi:hypothetical protein